MSLNICKDDLLLRRHDLSLRVIAPERTHRTHREVPYKVLTYDAQGYFWVWYSLKPPLGGAPSQFCSEFHLVESVQNGGDSFLGQCSCFTRCFGAVGSKSALL